MDDPYYAYNPVFLEMQNLCKAAGIAFNYRKLGFDTGAETYYDPKTINMSH